MTVASREEGIMEARLGGVEQNVGNVRNIVFFDVETNVPGRMFRGYELLEFGAVVLDARGLAELGSFHTLIRPKDLSCIDRRTSDCNTITTATVADAPAFEDVAGDIYRLLHGHIWAGHNILKFDILRVNEAFLKIGLQAPQPSGVVDTYPLLRKTFGKRAGNYKLATLANYCGYGKQEHRSIADVRMNINVLRSCATILFLESNYPDVFMAEMEVTTTSTLMLEQSASISTSSPQSRLSDDNLAEQEVDSQFRSSDQATDSSSISRRSHVQSRSRLSFKVDTNSGLLEVTESLGKSRLSSDSENVKLGALDILNKECSSTVEVQPHASSSSEDVREGKECVSSQVISNVSKVVHILEDNLIGYEQINKKIRVAEIVDAKSGKMEAGLTSLHDEQGQSQDASIPNKSALDHLEESDNEVEQDLAEALLSLSLKEGLQDTGAHDSSISKSDLSYSDSRTEFEVPFLLASHVNLPSIEVREEPSSFGCNRMLYYNGFPLHLLEFKMRVRFTVNLSYAFDDRGKPRFSLLMELSESASNVISKCEDAVKGLPECDNEAEWLPALRKESGCWVARMSIGTKWAEPFSRYTTEFFRSTSGGLEKITLGHVDALAFRNWIPHGSIIDAGFGFYVFNVNNRTGVKLLAKHITLP